VFVRNFEYDTEGRIVKISSGRNSEIPGTICTIDYNGSEAIFTYPDNNTRSAFYLKYLLDQNNQPITRIASNTLQNDQVGYFQRSYMYDTTEYVYDGAGKILTEKYRQNDSTFFRPSYTVTQVSNTIEVKNFSNVGVNAMSWKSIRNRRNVTRYNSDPPLTGSSEITQDVTFGYTNNWTYPHFGKNAFIFQEFQTFSLPVAHYSRYSNYPDRFTSKTVEKNGNGVITSTENSDYAPKIIFNKQGLITKITFDANPQQVTSFEYVYSK
jgi:hypothetical protein